MADAGWGWVNFEFKQMQAKMVGYQDEDFWGF